MNAAQFHRQAMMDALEDAAQQTAVERKANSIAEAHVHATALLAAEQSTANLIAVLNGDRSFAEVGNEGGEDGDNGRWAGGYLGRLEEAVDLSVRAALDDEVGVR